MNSDTVPPTIEEDIRGTRGATPDQTISSEKSKLYVNSNKATIMRKLPVVSLFSPHGQLHSSTHDPMTRDPITLIFIDVHEVIF